MQRFEKQVIARLNMPYPLGLLPVDEQQCLVVATEDHGPILLSRPPYVEAQEIVSGPGGCMTLTSPGGGELYAIMGCFVGYQFQAGAIYRIARGSPADSAGATAWQCRKIVDLPFAHRMEIIYRGDEQWLVAASIAAGKKDAADWSRAGAVYAAAVPSGPGGAWKPRPILEGIHRNHGWLVTRLGGRRTLLISGQEGLFAAGLDAGGRDWAFEKIVEQEISEVAVCDLDGDGADELVTIEPFHGTRLRVYRRTGGAWTPAWESEIAFGHCLLAGMVSGTPSVLVSNRAGSRDLLLFRWDKSARGSVFPEPQRIAVDAGVGAANMLVVPHDGGDIIVSTNQVAGEIARYVVARDGG